MEEFPPTTSNLLVNTLDDSDSETETEASPAEKTQAVNKRVGAKEDSSSSEDSSPEGDAKAVKSSPEANKKDSISKARLKSKATTAGSEKEESIQEV